MKETPRQHFRWAAHTSGATAVKPKDYEMVGDVEAPSVYAAWKVLKSTERPLEIGDLLEIETGALHILKYVGFEEAHWVLPESKPELAQVPST
jgi:hypothetical protein